ncbi:hypothetical protein SAZ_23720 [Streptomyces noursei ZPM]|nr:hypothetical protein SAZ_23720 [Streptomyces noursei ZPM]EOT05759.1 hypothetical protein K530_01807 [Streptomyces noursei CCRC 11814]
MELTCQEGAFLNMAFKEQVTDFRQASVGQRRTLRQGSEESGRPRNIIRSSTPVEKLDVKPVDVRQRKARMPTSASQGRVQVHQRRDADLGLCGCSSPSLDELILRFADRLNEPCKKQDCGH